MAQQRAERLMNLHILLLGATRFVTKDVIRRACYGEHPATAAGDEAFERAFERDKDALRQIGAVIEVGSADAYFDDELGYRIPTEQTSLPEIRFESDEAAVLGLAAQVWQQATLAKATGRALAKLKGQGVEIDPSRLEVMAPSIAADEPAFEPLWDAVGKRRQVTFPYQRATETEPATRRLQPWGLVRSSGRWYVVGHDVDRGEERVFRLSRIVGPVKATGKSGAYVVPAGHRRTSPGAAPLAVLPVRARRGAGPPGHRGRPASSRGVGDPRPGRQRLGRRGRRRTGPPAGRRDPHLRPGRRRAVAGRPARGDRRATACRGGGVVVSTSADTAPDQVARLLALVPYLLARGEVRLDEAAAHFDTDADQIERDLRLLFMTGLSPGLPGDLIEVDLEALEGERIIRVDNADYLARPVRFAPAEATALVVALRTMLDSAPPGAQDVVRRTLAKLEEAAGHRLRGPPAPARRAHAGRDQRGRAGPRASHRGRPPGRADLSRALARPADQPGRRSARPGPRGGPDLPRRVVPHRPGRPCLPGRPDPGRDRAGHGRGGSRGSSARPHRRLVHRRRHDHRHPPPGTGRALGHRVLPRHRPARSPPTAPSRSISRSRARSGCARWCCDWRPTQWCSPPPTTPEDSPRPPGQP